MPAREMPGHSAFDILRVLRGLWKRLFPSSYDVMQRLWYVHRPLWLDPARHNPIAARYGLTVLDGPFHGMIYVSMAVGSTISPKLLGCYEAELHQALERLISAGYETIIDIGCAEGYYAVGLALRVPEARVYAFDGDPLARRLCRKLARLNGVETRVRLGGFCDVGQLRSLACDRALLVCDCEGCELDVLRPDLVPAMQQWDILVELHDMYDPSTSRTILDRFALTHTVQLVASVFRDPATVARTSFLPPEARHTAVYEGVARSWAILTPKARQ